jgi:two-component system osmolarity sensor histidine kinase EnvZ
VQGDSAPRLGPAVPLLPLLQELAQPYAARGLQLQLDDSVARALPETALRRLLGNLLDNAFDHGAAPVLLQLQREGAALCLRVEDGGAGIAAADFERAQQPFVRLDESRGVGHCGLGLAIAAQLARQLGGHLRLRERSPAAPFAIELLIP